MKNPLVSIILSTYNGNHNWLSESIDSVLNQSFTDFELIIINDCSTNDIEKTILEYKQKDNRIVYIKNEKNLGLTASLNKGIKNSNGKYIARIDDDDIWCDNDKLKKQFDFMEQNPNYGLCGTGEIFINNSGEKIGKSLYTNDDKTIRKKILGSNQFNHSSIIIRKTILDEVGGYHDKNYTKYAEDYDLWLRIGIKSKLYNILEYSTIRRINNSKSISGNNPLKQRINAFKIVWKYKKYYPNKIQGITKQILTIILPKKILNILVSLKNKRTQL